MTLTVDANTYAAYQAARRDGIIVRRNMIWFTGKNRVTAEIENIGVWDGPWPLTIPVYKPSDGTVENRVYQPMQGRMSIPKIPRKLALEVRTITLSFSDLSPAIVNAVRAFDPRKRPIEIHRGLLDPISRQFVAPAHCRWDGLVNRAPITKAKAGDDGKVEVETVSHAQWLTMASADKMDAHFFEGRGDQAGKYISTIWKVPVPWGQSSIVHHEKDKPREHFLR